MASPVTLAYYSSPLASPRLSEDVPRLEVDERLPAVPQFERPADARSELLGEEPRLLELLPLLRDASLETLTIPASSPAAGKLIAHLKLRTVSGASIVGIERNGESIINPGVGEEIHAGYAVLLLGSEAQIERGGAVLIHA